MTQETDITLSVVKLERYAQDAKWGQQNHQDLAQQARATNPDTTRAIYGSFASQYKRVNDARVKDGDTAWDGILLEEVYEALELAGLQDREEDMAYELAQVAAVAVAWIEAIQRRQRARRVAR